MVYVEHVYGSYRRELRALLAKRLRIKERIRHHAAHLAEHGARLKAIEGEIQGLKERADYQDESHL